MYSRGLVKTAYLISSQEIKWHSISDEYNTQMLNTHNESIISRLSCTCGLNDWTAESLQPREKHSELFRAPVLLPRIIDRSSQHLSQARVTLSDSLLPDAFVLRVTGISNVNSFLPVGNQKSSGVRASPLGRVIMHREMFRNARLTSKNVFRVPSCWRRSTF